MGLRSARLDLLMTCRHPPCKLRLPYPLLRGRQLHGGAILSEGLATVNHVVEQGDEGLVVALAERIELVIMALRTGNGQAKPD